MFNSISKERVYRVLEQVMDPEVGRSIMELNMVRSVEIENGQVSVEIALTVRGCPLAKTLEEDVRRAVETIPGVSEVIVKMGTMSPEELQRFVGQIKARHPQAGIEHIRHIVAVGSGKGGVGKSTIALNLALSFLKLGKKVGLFDADIWGPSIAKMLNLRDMPIALADHLIEPLEAFQMKVMTFGTILRENQPVIWRGPMAHKAIEQFLLDTLWGELDYLIVDLPPGTGDVAISVSQLARIDGAVLVTTPQEVSALDVRKAINMFRSMSVRILGVVENMAYFRCSRCLEKHYIFGKNGAQTLSDLEHVPVLGQVPLDITLMEAEDNGLPFMFNVSENNEVYSAILDIARNIYQIFESTH